jgi:hypothetical protein
MNLFVGAFGFPSRSSQLFVLGHGISERNSTGDRLAIATSIGVKVAGNLRFYFGLAVHIREKLEWWFRGFLASESCNTYDQNDDQNECVKEVF